VARVARARRLPEQNVRDLVQQATVGRTFGILGEPRVNVLELNLSLDALPAQ
jgi:K+-transporting ATPase ATPase C chain